MSASLETRPIVPHDPMPRATAWRMALAAPLVLALPWIVLSRSLRVPAEEGTLRVLLLILLLTSAAITDLLWRRIYNWTTYSVFVWVVVLELLAAAFGGAQAPENGSSFSAAVVASLGMLPWRESLAGFAVGFAILFVLYNVFRGGAGDLKLVAVLGSLIGVSRIIEVLIYSYILAGVFAACLVVGLAGPRSILAFAARCLGIRGRNAESSQGVRDCLRRQVPMAPFLACGTLIALLWG